jgi:SRSO17 transposase
MTASVIGQPGVCKIRGLLADVPRKNSWQLAERAGHRTAYWFEWFLNGAKWDADVLRDEVRSYVVEGLGGNSGAKATLVIDDTQVIKNGDKSVGVAPQHCGADRADRELPGDRHVDLRHGWRSRLRRPGVVPTGPMDR